jgi:hypothetical protein
MPIAAEMFGVLLLATVGSNTETHCLLTPGSLPSWIPHHAPPTNFARQDNASSREGIRGARAQIGRRMRAAASGGSLKLNLLLFAGLFALSLAQNVSQVNITVFHEDETRWLNRGRYVAELLTPRGLTWSDHYVTRGQPPGGSYLMGIGLLAQGRPLQPNGVWDFGHNMLWNIRHGNMPAQVDLAAGRRTNAVVGALTVGVVYLLGQRLTNVLGGVAGALALAFHPLFIRLSSQALSDTLFVLIVALAALTACQLADKPTWPRTLLLGTLLGLGGLTKLSPLLLSGLLAALGAFLVVRPSLPWSRLRVAPDLAAQALGQRLLTLPAVAFAVFVLGYPYLWPDPVGRTYLLFAFRAEEMGRQIANWPRFAISNPGEAATRIWDVLGEQHSVGDRLMESFPLLRIVPTSLDLLLAVGGAGMLLWIIRRRGPDSSHALAGAILLGQGVLIVIGLRVDYVRYYLPLILVNAVMIGVFVGFVMSAARERVWPSSSLCHGVQMGTGTCARYSARRPGSPRSHGQGTQSLRTDSATTLQTPDIRG